MAVRFRARYASYQHMDQCSGCRGRIGRGADRLPGVGRVDRVCSWRMDRGITVGAGLPAHGGDVHQSVGRDFDRIPRAPRALADPPPFVLRNRDRLSGPQRHQCPLWVKSRHVRRTSQCPPRTNSGHCRNDCSRHGLSRTDFIGGGNEGPYRMQLF